jgi:hypothetical protein
VVADVWSCTGLEAVSGFAVAVDEGGNGSEEEGIKGGHCHCGARLSQAGRASLARLQDKYCTGTINIEINMMVIETVYQMAIFFMYLNSPNIHYNSVHRTTVVKSIGAQQTPNAQEYIVTPHAHNLDSS